MKSRIMAVLFVIILLLIFSGCAEPETSYLVVAEYEIDGGTQTATVIVFEGLVTPVMDAEVRVNGYLIDPFFFIYTDFDFITLSPGDTVNVSVKIGGTEIMNNSVVIPGAPTIISPADNSNVASGASLPLTWTGPVVDKYVVAIDSWDTVSEDGYSAFLSGSVTSHIVPGNKLLVSGAFPANIMVGAVNSTMGTGDLLMPASELVASNIDSIAIYQD